MSVRQSVSRDSRQCRDYAEIIQSEQIHLRKDNGHQQVHQERGAAGVQAAHQTDSQDGELHLRWHVVINQRLLPPRGSQDIQGDLICGWSGGYVLQFQEQLYHFDTSDWSLSEIFTQIDPFPPPDRTTVTFLSAQFPLWLTDSFTQQCRGERV